ncbi:MAG TPA: alpha/beta hydrolase [Candidatus Cybelea sp.]
MLAEAALALAAAARTPATGAYRIGRDIVYVGVDAEPPDRPSIEFYDTATRRLGTLDHLVGDEYKTDDSPRMTFVLSSPRPAVLEKPFVITDGNGHLGASLWYARGARRYPTVVLIQGADDSTRRMGFLIPFFVAHGLNVVTYDQRGTGDSTGSWRFASPQSKAIDTVALLQHVQSDPAVDRHRIGAWAASNGGWVAPIIATRFPLAFMILKSAPSGTIADNVLYEIEQVLREGSRFSPQQVSDAMAFERRMFDALQTDSNWGAAAQAFKAAQTQPWFSQMRMPPGMTVPPSAPMLAAMQAALIYDPTPILQQVRTPTLAIFGARDRNVDAAASAVGFRRAFARAGMTDLTIVTIPEADHLLVRSATGYEDDALLPVRFAGAYPEVMIGWLTARGFCCC